ncbi:hypothetical protein AB0L63_30320 [Nocardia sp. NPDC051990]|uniref:hypothetical protein n=1 Tax=Nocardia sp. NPDC051990 TaxID=3155285 RepID=UPI00343C8662
MDRTTFASWMSALAPEFRIVSWEGRGRDRTRDEGCRSPGGPPRATPAPCSISSAPNAPYLAAPRKRFTALIAPSGFPR